MRSRITIFLALILAGLALGGITPGAASAQAFGDKVACWRPHHAPQFTGTLKWGFFPGHDVLTDMAVCTKPMCTAAACGARSYLSWVGQPRITLPCASGVRWVTCPTETVSVVDRPFIARVVISSHRVVKVVYRFSVKQCSVVTLSTLCSTFGFKLRVTPVKFREKNVAGGINPGQLSAIHYFG